MAFTKSSVESKLRIAAARRDKEIITQEQIIAEAREKVASARESYATEVENILTSVMEKGIEQEANSEIKLPEVS